MPGLARRLAAEFVGCLFLAAAVVGSGIAAQTLSPTDPGLELTENAIATALVLYVVITVLAPLSGAHLNPVVSLVDAALGRKPWREVPGYLASQLLGCAAGVGRSPAASPGSPRPRPWVSSRRSSSAEPWGSCL
jgi:arsenate reductase